MPQVRNPQPLNPDVIREDFDRIAKIPDENWNHNSHYHKYLLRHIPHRMDRAMDVGCGKGEFTRLLAERTAQVEGIDLSPEMITEAKKVSAVHQNITYVIADIRKAVLEPSKYDCITSIATFHHLPLRETLEQLKEALAPDGVLVVLDLYKTKTVWDIFVSAIAFSANVLCRCVKTGRIKETHPEEWRIHSEHEAILPLREIQTICRAVLPGARVKRHLFWRYSIVWVKSDT